MTSVKIYEGTEKAACNGIESRVTFLRNECGWTEEMIKDFFAQVETNVEVNAVETGRAKGFFDLFEKILNKSSKPLKKYVSIERGYNNPVEGKAEECRILCLSLRGGKDGEKMIILSDTELRKLLGDRE